MRPAGQQLGQPRAVATLATLLGLALAPAAARADLPAATVPVHISFVAEVNGKPFDCGTTYQRVGAGHATWQPQDLRFYVSDVVLTAHSGAASHDEGLGQYPVTLQEDGEWQQADVALLDFEDRSGSCQNGTQPTNRSLHGTASKAAQAARGLRFQIGVPFSKNHADASAAMPPLDQAGLFWGWQGGYKFFTLDGRVDGRFGHSVHIGSTGCALGAHGTVSSCARPNRATVTIAHFNAARDEVVLDIGALLAHSDLAKTADASHNGCMGEADNPACGPLLAAFGLEAGLLAHHEHTAQPIFRRRVRR